MIYEYLNLLQEQNKWFNRATNTMAITLYQIDEIANPSNREQLLEFVSNLYKFASNVKDKNSYNTFIRYNKDVLNALDGR